MDSYPKFHNEIGVPIVRIGCREFKCIGDKPPQDHPQWQKPDLFMTAKSTWKPNLEASSLTFAASSIGHI
jgi:hypothetical protein